MAKINKKPKNDNISPHRIKAGVTDEEKSEAQIALEKAKKMKRKTVKLPSGLSMDFERLKSEAKLRTENKMKRLEKKLFEQMYNHFSPQLEARIKALKNDGRMPPDKKEASKDLFEKQKGTRIKGNFDT